MWKVIHWARCVGLLAPAIFLIFVAAPRFRSGLAIDAAYPVPILMVVDVSLPQSSYRNTAAILAKAHHDDGETLLQRAEALSLAPLETEDVVGLLQEGLTKSPASVRGWALLAEQLDMVDQPKAVQALEQSLLLGPYEYYVASKRARETAILWDTLSTDGRAAAQRQARLLWTEARLNEGILRLVNTQGGSEILARAFLDEPAELRAINRWITSERRKAGH